MSGEDSFEILLAIRGDLGELKGLMKASQSALQDHVLAASVVEKRVAAIEIEQARGKGAARALMVAASVIAGAIGAAGGLLAHFKIGGP